MHEDPRKAPLPDDPAAHPDAVGRPVDASSRIAFTTSDGQPVEVPLLTLVPIPRLTIDEAAVGFDMEVHAYTSKSPFQLPPEIKKTELDELFVNCDIISLHCPLTDSTRELVNAARLKQMKPNAILINTGRGPLVNEQDLADALNNGTIFAAGLDVLSQEPPRADNPLLTARNCYITPHIAWASAAARERLMQIMLDNIKAFLDEKPINSVIK